MVKVQITENRQHRNWRYEATEHIRDRIIMELRLTFRMASIFTGLCFTALSELCSCCLICAHAAEVAECFSSRSAS